MNKRVSALLFSFLLFFTHIFADSVMSPFTKLQKIETTYFDIIFPEESEQTAFYLAEEIDFLYEKATALLNAEKTLHLPVVICPCTQELNAHYNPFPYGHICVYDTLEVGSTDLIYYKKALNEIFYHELIHAVSLTIKSEEAQAISHLFIPDFSMNLVTLNLSWDEGVTVSSESKDGFGRMNNGFVLNYLVQSKIDGIFPNFYEIACRSYYPSGAYPYYFGGAFSKYLQETYGQNKYADFFHQEEHLVKKAFEINYDKKIWEVWDDFEDSIPVPELADSSCVERFDNFAINLTSAQIDGQPFIAFFAPYKYGIFGFTPGIDKKTKRILKADQSLKDFSFSSDGNYLLLTDFAPDNKEELRLRVYDYKNKSFTKKTLKNSALGELVSAGGKSYLVCLEVISTDSAIKIYDFDSMELTATVPLQHFTEVTEICRAKDGFCFILRHEGTFSFNYVDLTEPAGTLSLDKTISVQTYELPAEIIPYYLNCEDEAANSFVLSVAGHDFTADNPDFPASMPRLARVVISEAGKAGIQFQKTDVTGSVYNPVYAGGTYYFSSLINNQRPLSFFTDGVPGGFSNFYELPQTNIPQAFEFYPKTLPSQFTISDYKGVKYLKKGLLLPVGIVPDTYSDTLSSSRIYSPFIFGPCYTSGVPSENSFFSVSGGYNLNAYSFGSNFTFLTGNKNCTFSFNSGIFFFANYFNQAYAELDFSGSTPLFSRRMTLKYQLNSFVQYFGQTIFNNINMGGIGIAYGFLTGMGSEDRFVISSSISFYNALNSGVNIGIISNLSLPGLFFIKNPYMYTVNFPSKFTFSLIPDSSTFLSGKGTVTLFQKEIQKQPGNASLYLHRINLTAGYLTSFKENLPSLSILNTPQLFRCIPYMKEVQAVTGGCHLDWTPVIGAMANLAFDLGIDLTWYIRNDISSKPYDITLCGIYTF